MLLIVTIDLLFALLQICNLFVVVDLFVCYVDLFVCSCYGYAACLLLDVHPFLPQDVSLLLIIHPLL
jgi:hypothetical protein